MGDHRSVTVRTIDLHEDILFILATLTIKVEEFLEVGIEIMLATLDESLGSIDSHLQMCLRVA